MRRTLSVAPLVLSVRVVLEGPEQGVSSDGLSGLEGRHEVRGRGGDGEEDDLVACAHLGGEDEGEGEG